MPRHVTQKQKGITQQQGQYSKAYSLINSGHIKTVVMLILRTCEVLLFFPTQNMAHDDKNWTDKQNQ